MEFLPDAMNVDVCATLSPPFRYKSLDQTEIRLIRITPSLVADGNQNLDFSCDLVHFSFDNILPYRALSYTWGSEDHGTKIIRVNGFSYAVRLNLWHALKTLQAEAGTAFYLWADAICIDQMNNQERDHQLRLMGPIYQKADQVVLWLGLESNDSTLAINLLRDLHVRLDSHAAIKSRLSYELATEELKAVAALFSRDFWKRLWIVQEFVLGKDPVVYCGSKKVSALALTEVQQTLFVSSNLQPDVAEALDRLCSGDIATFSAIQNLGPRMHDISRTTFQKRKMTLLECLDFHFNKVASEPRDMIYGLLGMTDALETGGIQISYSKSVESIYTDFARHEIETSNRLDLLLWTTSYGSPTLKALPSWVPDWSVGKRGYGVFPQSLPHKHRASRDRSADARICVGDPTKLVVKGINVARIGVKSSPAETKRTAESDEPAMARTFYEWIKLLDHVPGDLYDKYESFSRTVLFDDLQNQNDSMFSELSRENCYRATTAGLADLHRRHMPQVPLDPDTVGFAARYHFSRDMKEHERWSPGWLSCWAWAATGKRFFVTTSTNYLAPTMGLGLDGVEEEDLVCVLMGCDRPIILRAQQDGTFVVRGPAYIEGIMYGEAIDLLNRGACELKEFTLK